MKYFTENKKIAWGLMAILALDILVVGTIGEQLEADGQTFILTLLALKVAGLSVAAAHFFIESDFQAPRTPSSKSNS